MNSLSTFSTNDSTDWSVVTCRCQYKRSNSGKDEFLQKNVKAESREMRVPVSECFEDACNASMPSSTQGVNIHSGLRCRCLRKPKADRDRKVRHAAAEPSARRARRAKLSHQNSQASSELRNHLIHQPRRVCTSEFNVFMTLSSAVAEG